MSVEGYPKWSRVLDTIIGILLLIIGIWVILYVETAYLTVILLFSISLASVGASRMLKGIKVVTLTRGNRIMNVLVGIIAIILSSLVFMNTTLAVELLLQLITIGFVFVGIVRLSMGFKEEIPQWARGLHILTGGLLVGFGIIIFLFTSEGFVLLAWIIAVNLIWNGIVRITNGATGKLR